MAIALRPRIQWMIGGPACLAALALALGGDDPKAKPKAESATLVLFDGKTLDGWKKADFYKPGEVKVEKGAIQLLRADTMTGVTSTRKDLPKLDYELTYEASRTSGEDFFAAATFPVGDSFITFVNGGWGGNVTGLSSLDGADASENETTINLKYENNKWYEFRIRVTADVIRCQVDGKAAVDVKIRDRQVGTRIEVRENQPLGFATWESGGAIRKVVVRKMTADEIKKHNEWDEK